MENKGVESYYEEFDSVVKKLWAGHKESVNYEKTFIVDGANGIGG